jgi:C1A family cysteine protease
MMSKWLRFRKKAYLIRLTILAALGVVLAGGVPVFGQLSERDIETLKQQAEAEGWTFTVGENPATQYSLDQLCGLKVPDNWQVGARFDPCIPTRALPDSFDWRDSDGCTPVKNQGGCGSCWAFATVGPLECNIKIKDGVTTNLSEQWVVSCNQEGWGCSGGWFAHDYHEWKPDPCGGTGAVYESDFPYTATDATCNCPYPHQYTIDSWAYVGPSSGVPSVDAMKQAIMDYGPISVAVHANSAMQAYTGGIFTGCDGTGEINHAVVLVGWDDNQGTGGVWFMRNSWGTGWGEDGGYMRMEYGCSNIGYGACYVNYAGAEGLSFEYPGGVPSILPPEEQTTFGVNVAGVYGGTPVPGTGKIYCSVNGGAYTQESMTQTAPNEYTATLPDVSCSSRISFYVSCDEVGGETYYDPDTTNPNTAIAATDATVIFQDDFETNKGWTVAGDATDGQWERGVPVGGGDRGDPPTDYDGSGNCYLTDNVDGNSDVDGGTTTLISPTFDLSLGEGRIHYATWFCNNVGADPFTDVMEVYISNNDGSSWTLAETVGPVEQAEGGWFESIFWASDFITLTNQMKLRVDVSDFNDGSVVEGGIDDVDITVFSCASSEPTIITSSLPDWTVGFAYSRQLEAIGGTGELAWSDKYNDLAGTGLSLSASGLVSGTPASTGEISFTAVVTDEGRAFDEEVFSFTINDVVSIVTQSVPDWTQGEPYSVNLEVAGGTEPIGWIDVDNDLYQTGLSLSTEGLLSGTPINAGPLTFTAVVVDGPGSMDQKEYSFTINPILEITTESVGQWTVDIGFYSILEATGGTGALTWSDKNNDLEGTGMDVSVEGYFGGIPNSTGDFSFTALVTDQIGASDEKYYSITINPHVQILTTSLPDWTLGVPYSSTLMSTGGTPLIFWVDEGNELDGTGLTLTIEGVVSGTPAVEGPVSFYAVVKDGAGDSDTRQYNFTINPALTITTTSLPYGIVDEPYSEQLTSAGGTGSHTWTDKNGDLYGTGLTLSSDGLVSGTVTEKQTISFIARVEDQVGGYDEEPYEFQVVLVFVCGDVDADDSLNMLDILYLIAYLYKSGPVPVPPESGDVNNSGGIDMLDVLYMISFLYKGGPAPTCP